MGQKILNEKEKQKQNQFRIGALVLRLNAQYRYPIPAAQMKFIAQDWSEQLAIYDFSVVYAAYSTMISQFRERPSLADWLKFCSDRKKLLEEQAQAQEKAKMRLNASEPQEKKPVILSEEAQKAKEELQKFLGKTVINRNANLGRAMQLQ